MKSAGSAGTGSRIAVFLVLFIFLPLVFVSLYLAGNLYSAADFLEPYTLSIVAGAAAYVLFQGQFLISSRIGFLERIIPQDKLIFMHAVSGLTVSVFILAHFILKWILVLRWLPLTLQSAVGMAALVFYAVLAPTAALVLFGLRRSGRRRLSFQRAKALHNFLAVAGVLVTVHVLLAASTWSPALRIFAAGWSVLCLGAYAHHKILRPRKRQAFVLESTVEVVPGIHRFAFSFDSPGRSPARIPGQFGYWSFETGAKRAGGEGLPGSEEHPFSISSPPGEGMEITVRSSGDFTEALPGVPQGTKVFFDGPYGGFSPAGLPKGAPLLFLAGGIGITPFLSMIGEDGPFEKHPVSLLWSIRGPEEAALGSPLTDRAERGDFFMRTVFTKSAPAGAPAGRIDAAMIRDAATSLSERTGRAGARLRVFLCGPPDFSRAMRLYLRGLGISRRSITEERFSR